MILATSLAPKYIVGKPNLKLDITLVLRLMLLLTPNKEFSDRFGKFN